MHIPTEIRCTMSSGVESSKLSREEIEGVFRHTHIRQYHKEEGKDHFYKVQQTEKDLEVSQKIWVELEVADGPYSALQPKYLTRITNVSFMQAVNNLYSYDNTENATLIAKALLGERQTPHSRQSYLIKSDTFKSMISGRFVIELLFNQRVNFTQSELNNPEFINLMNKYSVEGVKFVSLTIRPKDLVLRNFINMAYMQFTFDDRMVNGFDLSTLKEKISQFYNPKIELKYKLQQVTGSSKGGVQKVTNIMTPLPKEMIHFMTASIGNNKHETVLRMFMDVNSLHPMTFLASFLGTPTTNRPYASIYGVQSKIIGFYERSSYKSDSGQPNIFNISQDSSNICPECGKPKIINVMTGQPFGFADYEKVIGHPSVCQECHARLS